EVIRAHHFSTCGRVPVIARQAAVSRNLAYRVAWRHEPRRPDLVHNAPEIEVLQRALGEILTLGYLLEAGATFDERAGDAAQPQLHGERNADRTCAHYDNLMPRPLTHGRGYCIATACHPPAGSSGNNRAAVDGQSAIFRESGTGLDPGFHSRGTGAGYAPGSLFLSGHFVPAAF